MFYDEMVNALNVQCGDNIWLSSELILLIFKLKAKGVNFDGSSLIDAFLNAVGRKGTILIPTFSFDFSNKQLYDIKNTKGTAGMLGNIALARNDFKRTKHPLHSFAVCGKDQEYLISMENKHSFGVDSPFGYCVGKNVKQIILGTDYVHAMTFIHYAEAVCNVPYRFPKSFTGKYINDLGKEEVRTYDYSARKLEIEPVEKFNRIGSILEDMGISKKLEFEGITCYIIDLAASFPVICKDILENQCSNIYDFNIPRNEIFN